MNVGIVSFGAGATQWTGKRAKNSLGQGCHIVRQCCIEAGIDVADLHEGWRSVDVLMVGMYWWEHLYDLVALLAARGIEPRREKRCQKPIVIVGGQLVSYNPGPASVVADAAVIGDGELAAPALLKLIQAGAPAHEWASVPGVYVSGLDNLAEWQHVDDITATVRWPYINRTRTVGESGVMQEEVFERRLEVARGCQKKCAYCGVGWTKKYREVPTEMVVAELRSSSGCIKSFAPDYMAHSGWDQISATYDETERYNQARDISSRVILTKGFGKSRSYSTGIDGLSERLRRACSKPLSCDELVEIIEKASGHMGSLGVYQILDLPGEEPVDYEEWFRSLLRVKLRERVDVGRYTGPEGGFYILATLNAFCPTPHTPLQWEGVNLRPSCWDRYAKALDILGPRTSRLLQHKVLGRPHGAVSRLLEGVALRGEPDLGPFIVAMAKLRPAMRNTLQVFDVARRLGLEDMVRACVSPRSTDVVLPWERRVKPLFPRATLLKGRERYHRVINGGNA